MVQLLNPTMNDSDIYTIPYHTEKDSKFDRILNKIHNVGKWDVWCLSAKRGKKVPCKFIITDEQTHINIVIISFVDNIVVAQLIYN